MMLHSIFRLASLFSFCFLLEAQYAGSAACKTCHSTLYGRWSKTRMANVVRDPREHPGAIIPDLSKPNSVFPFSGDDVTLVYGSKWKQRYFKKIGDDYFPLPVQWDVTHKIWAPYVVKTGTDWWTLSILRTISSVRQVRCATAAIR